MERATGFPPPKRRRARKTQNQNTTTIISDLAAHIICEILSRLPLKSIFRCKEVCKTWRDLLMEPCFAKSHLLRSPPCLIFLSKSNSKKPFHFGVLELDDPTRLLCRDATMKFRTEIHIPDGYIVGLCNGLICLTNSLHPWDTLIVCNPIRRQHFTIPKPPNMASHSVISQGNGFGYSPSTDQYKVVRFTETYFRNSTRLFCDIYTLGNDEPWRSIEVTGQPPPSFFGFVFLNGSLHWISSGSDDFRFLCCFDIGTEQFGNLPLPAHVVVRFMGFGVVDNCLYFCNQNSSSVSIWLMKDYGNIGSLTLEWVIELPFPQGLIEPFKRWYFLNVKPVKVLKDGTVLMTFDKKTLASYNPETRILKKLKYHGVRFWTDSVSGVPSFLFPMDRTR